MKHLTEYQISNCILLITAYYKLQVSDFGDNETVVKAMNISQYKVFTITGKSIHQLPSEMLLLIKALKEL